MAIKKLMTKITALLCMGGVTMVNNVQLASAYEAHVMNVTATIIDNSVTISPEGGKFCNDGKLKVELTTPLSGAKIYYTLNGSEPKCETNGTLYSTPFTLLSDKTVKAVSCYEGKQSAVASQTFDISASYCESSLKINKVYYNPDKAHMAGTCNNENEWVEIYNPGKDAINLKGWSICDSEACDVLSSKDLTIASKGYAVITYKDSTWNYWNVPDNVIKITLGNAIGNGLYNPSEMLYLKDSSSQIVDQMNWGTPDKKWPNYNSSVWNPGIAGAAEGKILGRSPNGYDTDQVSDWQAFSLPTVEVTYPNGGESWTVGATYTIKWTAKNPNGSDSNLSIDLYYSKDSGSTWANIAKNTENDGTYEWRVPLALNNSDGSNYLTPSSKARIKVVATDYTRNFMLSASDKSNNDFCPPIDKSLLTAEELELLKTIDTTGMEFINSPAQTNVSASGTDTTDPENNTEIKQNPILNKEEDLPVSDVEEGTDNDTDKESETTTDAPANTTEENLTGTAAQDDSAETSIVTDETSGQENTVSNATDLPITPDGGTASIEFNLNS